MFDVGSLNNVGSISYVRETHARYCVTLIASLHLTTQDLSVVCVKELRLHSVKPSVDLACYDTHTHEGADC